ncbi:MAG: hypothetical protein LBB25_02865 [Holosporaceae bacterium]|nr:hypothetical protein [Holosporaceae bacterium]
MPKTNVSSIQLLLLSAVYARHIKLLCYVGGDKNNELKLQQVKQLIHWKQSVVTYQSGTTECMRLILEWRDKLGPGNQLTTLLQEYRNTVGLVSFKNGQAVTIDAATGRQIGIADRSIVIQVVKTPPTNLEERHRDAIMNFVISGNTKVSLTNRPLTEDEMMLLVDGLIAFSVEFAAGSIREDLEMGLELADVKTPSDLRSWQDTVNAVLELSSQVQYGELALRNTAAAIPGCPDLLKDKFMAVLSMAKWHAQAEYGRSMATFTNPEHSMLELSWAAGVGRVRLNSTVADALRTGARRAGEKADELERRLREQARTAEDVLE